MISSHQDMTNPSTFLLRQLQLQNPLNSPQHGLLYSPSTTTTSVTPPRIPPPKTRNRLATSPVLHTYDQESPPRAMVPQERREGQGVRMRGKRTPCCDMSAGLCTFFFLLLYAAFVTFVLIFFSLGEHEDGWWFVTFVCACVCVCVLEEGGRCMLLHGGGGTRD